MVTCIPEQPRFANPTEGVVWERLRAQLRPQDVLLANQRFTDHVKDTEIDLLVVMPGHGIVAVTHDDDFVTALADNTLVLGRPS